MPSSAGRRGGRTDCDAAIGGAASSDKSTASSAESAASSGVGDPAASSVVAEPWTMAETKDCSERAAFLLARTLSLLLISRTP